MWLDKWLINIYKSDIYGQIYDVITHKNQIYGQISG
jgi:hypothetical protein